MTSEKLKVLHVIDTIDQKSGGPVECLLQFARQQVEDVQTTIVSLDVPGSIDVSHCEFPVWFAGQDGALAGLMKTFRYTPKLREWLTANAAAFDAVVIHGIWTYAALGTWLGLRGVGGRRIPYVVFAHGMLDPWFRRTYPLKHLKKQLFWTLFLGRVFRDSKSVIFTAEDEKRGADGVFVGYNSYPKSIIPLGVEKPAVDLSVAKAKFLEKVCSPQGRRFVLFLGRIHPKKGCDLLIEGFSAFAKEHTDIDLVMAGPDHQNWAPKLKKIAQAHQISDRIYWPGMLTGLEKWGALFTADALILPSHQENFGIAVAEALSCHVPVLISDKVNIWREIKEAHAGFVAEDTLPGVIEMLRGFAMLDTEERQRLSTQAALCHEQWFEAKANANKLTGLLRKFVSSN